MEVDVRPAEALNWAGETESEKSASETLRDKEVICCPLVPVTTRFRELPVTAFRLLTVSVLVCPTRIEPGLNEQLAEILPRQARLTLPEKPEAPEAETVKLVESVPRMTIAELLPAES